QIHWCHCLAGHRHRLAARGAHRQLCIQRQHCVHAQLHPRKQHAPESLAIDAHVINPRAQVCDPVRSRFIRLPCSRNSSGYIQCLDLRVRHFCSRTVRHRAGERSRLCQRFWRRAHQCHCHQQNRAPIPHWTPPDILKRSDALDELGPPYPRTFPTHFVPACKRTPPWALVGPADYFRWKYSAGISTFNPKTKLLYAQLPCLRHPESTFSYHFPAGPAGRFRSISRGFGTLSLLCFCHQHRKVVRINLKCPVRSPDPPRPSMRRRLQPNRRDFLKTCAASAVLAGKPPGLSYFFPAPEKSRVVISRDPLLRGSGSSLDSARLLNMLDRAMQALFATDSPLDA